MSSSDAVSSLHVAVMKHDLNGVKKASAGDVDLRDREGRTALFYAVLQGDDEIIVELLSLGADSNAKDRNQETPLHFAARGYQAQAAELLISKGAIVDAQDVHGNTALWRAVFESRGRGDLIKLLVSRGADAAKKNRHGSSPQDLACTIANYDLAGFLKS